MPNDSTDTERFDVLEGMAFALERRDTFAEAPLPLAVLLAEVGEWVSTARNESWKPEGKKPNKKNNRTSLRSEVQESQRILGARLREHLGEAFTYYLAAFNQVLSTPEREKADVATLVNAQQA